MFQLASTGMVQCWWEIQVVSLALTSDCHSNALPPEQAQALNSLLYAPQLPHCPLLHSTAQTMWSASHPEPQGEELLLTG